MKSYNSIFLLLVLSSCSKLFDKTPGDRFTPAEAFSTEENIQLYVNGFYSQLVPSAEEIYGLQGNLYFGDAMSDIAAIRDVPPYLHGVYSSNQAVGWDWGALRNINYFLENLSSANISDARKLHFEGVGRFFRAWFYYKKVKMFGDVPWYDTPLSPTDETLYKARDPRSVVMDLVLQDINFACDHISDIKDNTSSTITKWVALALKSRICLFEGTYRRYHDELGLTASVDQWLNEAADAAGKVMQSGSYSLNSSDNPKADYRALFVSENPVSTEVILASVYNANLRKWHTANWAFTSASLGPKLSLVKPFINTYLNLDGSRFTDNPSFQTTGFAEEVKNRDHRLSQTIRLGDYIRSENTLSPPDFNYTYTGYHFKKYTTEERRLDFVGENANSIPVFRYAEILLNYAEAKAELGQFSASDWSTTIAALRTRAGIQNVDFPMDVDKYLQENFFPEINSAVLLEIRRERGIELVGEGLRYDDLKRWKKGELLERTYEGIYISELNTLVDLNEDGAPDVSFVNSLPATQVPGVVYYIIDNDIVKLSDGTKGNLLWRANIEKKYPDYKYLAPIPFNELVMNKNLEQNEGWDKP